MIPRHTQYGLDSYVKDRQYPGSFLRALLENNLKNAVGYADDQNKENLVDIVIYCYNNIPSICWGSKEEVEAWLERREDKEDSKDEIARKVLNE